ncbi:MAG: DNA methyltransferase [Dehalococcoidia bacterium]
MNTNVLYYGDNLTWLRKHDYFPTDKINLIYLDPPYNSNANYNLIFNNKPELGYEESPAQIRAFGDTWKWETGTAKETLTELEARNPPIYKFLEALKESNVVNLSTVSYLTMMAVRLMELYRVLHPTGSLWLHCDPTASHYLKILLDLIFLEGKQQGSLQNEVVWAYEGGGTSNNRFSRKHDILLWYTKSKKEYTFNADTVRVPYKTKNIGPQTYHYDANKKRRPIFKEGFTYIPNPKGKIATDVWVDIKKPYGPSKELIGFPTQKPRGLLDRIIKATSNEGEIVLDPFCGCGTTIISAHSNNRQWIGIDVTYLAINRVLSRFEELFGTQFKDDSQKIKVIGDPQDEQSAINLWETDPKDFEVWVINRLVRAQAREKRGKDKGIDGLYYFQEYDGIKKAIIQVKGGKNLKRDMVATLRGDMQREDAKLGLLVTIHEPTKDMIREALDTDAYESSLWQKKIPRIQIKTVRQLMENQVTGLPPSAETTKKFELLKKEVATESLL